MTGSKVEKCAVLSMTTDLVVQWIKGPHPASMALPDMIEAAHRALSTAAKPSPDFRPDQPPAVPIKRSLTVDHLVCLEDGARFRTLKRHLMSAHGLTPEDYRTRWGLAADYPMVAPAYAKVRRGVAVKAGLGRHRTAGTAPAPTVSPPIEDAQGELADPAPRVLATR